MLLLERVLIAPHSTLCPISTASSPLKTPTGQTSTNSLPTLAGASRSQTRTDFESCAVYQLTTTIDATPLYRIQRQRAYPVLGVSCSSHSLYHGSALQKVSFAFLLYHSALPWFLHLHHGERACKLLTCIYTELSNGHVWVERHGGGSR